MGEDPFLPGLTDHTRQESGDSGLSVSMSQTPDFLSSIDDSMDGLSGELIFFLIGMRNLQHKYERAFCIGYILSGTI